LRGDGPGFRKGADVGTNHRWPGGGHERLQVVRGRPKKLAGATKRWGAKGGGLTAKMSIFEPHSGRGEKTAVFRWRFKPQLVERGAARSGRLKGRCPGGSPSGGAKAAGNFRGRRHRKKFLRNGDSNPNSRVAGALRFHENRGRWPCPVRAGGGVGGPGTKNDRIPGTRGGAGGTGKSAVWFGEPICPGGEKKPFAR